MNFVYLAGPISDNTTEEANGWRNSFRDRLSDCGLVGISPLRCEPKTDGKYKLFYDDICFGTQKAIAGKNRYDVQRCDATVAYLPSLSVGTLIELGWAKGYEKPVIVVSTLEGVYNHPLVEESSNWVVPNFDYAYEIIVGLLGDYR